jgi:hypothetical protein
MSTWERWVVALLDGRVKGVHVDVNNSAHRILRLRTPVGKIYN